jgi:hypothetical protein
MRLIYSLLLCCLLGSSYSQDVFEVVQFGEALYNARMYFSGLNGIYEKVLDPVSDIWSDAEYVFPGNSISIINPTDDILRAYVGHNSRIQEYIFDGDSWSMGNLFIVGERASAEYYYDQLGSLHIKVYAYQSNGDVYLHTFDEARIGLPGHGWTLGVNPVTEIP